MDKEMKLNGLMEVKMKRKKVKIKVGEVKDIQIAYSEIG